MKLPMMPPARVHRLIEQVETGRFEKTMSMLTSLGAVVTGIEVFLEHDRASFGNNMMWVPVWLSPALGAAGLASVVSKKAAKTLLPFTSLLVFANALQGQYLHIRGIAQRPGGWRLIRYNTEMGPPLFAPLLFAMVGGMGLLASLLRREDEQ